MSEAMTLQTLMGSSAVSQTANLTTAVVKPLHDFPVSKVSQAVTNQRD